MSVYKAVITTNNELMHFNKNHSRHNGQFISGDGDGDGVVDDHNEGVGKKAFNTYKKVTTNMSMVNYASQKAADNRKAKKQGINQTVTKPGKVKVKDMNPAELNKYGSRQIKKGIGFFATGLGLEFLGKTAMVVSEDYGMVVGGAAFLAGLGLQVSGIVSGIKGAVNKGKARDMEFNERYYREH